MRLIFFGLEIIELMGIPALDANATLKLFIVFAGFPCSDQLYN